MKRLTVLTAFFMFSACVFCHAGREDSMAGRFIPKNGKTILFAGQNNMSVSKYVKSVKTVPAGFMFYTALTDLNSLTKDTDFGAGETSGSFILKNYPKAAVQIGLYLVNSLDNVIEGSLDAEIKELGDWMKEAGVPVFLRIGYEFDYPENMYEPEKYIKAYRYIVDKLDEFGVTNAAYVWHSYASSNPVGIEAWYPGDEYVDWCAISYFTNPQWIPMVNFAKKHSKPLMIAECAPMLGHDKTVEQKAEWYGKLFRFIDKYNVKALCYINADWDSMPMFEGYKWGNDMLGADKEIVKLWKEKISGGRFINFKELYKNTDFKN
ncbi:MAG: glycoside hydrolase family 26 protein [Endomicrobium sp.]|jgi:hypothetical protein|nr:glycoside hydrolase family 26 protein [Endomicrobium sp.]